jgi:hypothetical protein
MNGNIYKINKEKLNDFVNNNNSFLDFEEVADEFPTKYCNGSYYLPTKDNKIIFVNY